MESSGAQATKRLRVTYEQRQILLDYMKAHPDLARGRVTGSEAVQRKEQALNKLARQLNAVDLGARKSADKWWKCWQDWKCDVKKKVLRNKNHENGTDEGPATPLSPLEIALLQFCEPEMVEDMDVPEVSYVEMDHASPSSDHKPEMYVFTSPSSSPMSDTAVKDTQTHYMEKAEDLQHSLDRQAAAMEKLSTAVEGMSTQLATAIQNGLAAIASAIERQPYQAFLSKD